MVNYFEITVVRDKAITQEMFRWYYYRRKKMIVMHCFSAAILLGALAYMFFFHLYQAGVIWIILALLLELILYRSYRLSVKMCLRRDLENNMGQPVTLTTIIHDDIIRTQMTAENGHDVLLNQMKWAVQTPKMIIICSKAKVLYALPNDCFVHGTPEELIRYLREKGIGK